MIALTQKDLSELQATYAASCYYYEPKQIAGSIKSRVHVDAPPKPPQGRPQGYASFPCRRLQYYYRTMTLIASTPRHYETWQPPVLLDSRR